MVALLSFELVGFMLRLVIIVKKMSSKEELTFITKLVGLSLFCMDGMEGEMIIIIFWLKSSNNFVLFLPHGALISDWFLDC